MDVIGLIGLVLIILASVIFPDLTNHSFTVVCTTPGAGMLSASPEHIADRVEGDSVSPPLPQ